MELAIKRTTVNILIIVVIFLGVYQCLLALDGYYFIYGVIFANILSFIFWVSICYLVLSNIAKMEKYWVKALLSFAVVIACVFNFVVAFLISALFWDYGYPACRVFPDPKSGNAIIVYQKRFVWLEEPKYELGVVRCRIFFDVLTQKKLASDDDTITFDWNELNPQIIWTKDMATVYMPNDNRIEIQLKR